jgi:wobble nucleotide-excising tRNase
LEALEAHFSAAYENFIEALDAKIRELEDEGKRAAELNMPNRAELYEDLANEYELAQEPVRKTAEEARQFLNTLIQKLRAKKGKPFDQLAEDVVVPVLDEGVVEKLNKIIEKHDKACDDFQGRVNEARDRLALDMIASDSEEFIRLRDILRQYNTNCEAGEKETCRLVDAIAHLEREIVEHRRPAEELNEDLRKYLGHGELSLEIKDTGYAITRNGVPAQSLCEGETSAIALLYFLKSLQDRRFDLKNGVVMLDDPVSSLDANALYLAFGFIRDRTKDAGQLFILTHNFTLFRQVRNWFHNLKGKAKKDARFYMLDCVCQDGQRSSMIVPLDPLLERYESDYHYLFARIYREANADSATTLEESYVLPNIARRVLEAFLAFRQPQVPGELWQKMNGLKFDEAKRLRILRFVHTYSHADTIGEPEHDPSLLAEARSVLRDVLEFIKSQDPQHFASMEELSKPPAPEGDGG